MKYFKEHGINWGLIIILILSLVMCFLIYKGCNCIFAHSDSASVPSYPLSQAGVESSCTMDDLLDAIEWVESRGDANALGDKVILKVLTKENFLHYLENEYNQHKTNWIGYQAASEEMVEVYEYQAVGSFQIHKIYVDDVNRILKTQGSDQRYTYEDRWGRDKSREMVSILTPLYTGIAEWNKDRPPTQMERFGVMARIHNGGPNGYKKESTKAYWLKVKARLEQ